HVAFLGGVVPARPRAAVGRLGFASLAKTIRAVQRCLSADQPVRGMNRASPDWGKRRQTAMGLWLEAALTVSGIASWVLQAGTTRAVGSRHDAVACRSPHSRERGVVSNDQNLWIALGLVTRTGAPSRG